MGGWIQPYKNGLLELVIFTNPLAAGFYEGI